MFKNIAAALLLGTSSLLLVPKTDAHFFWVNVDKAAGEVEVTFSEKAGVPDGAIQHLKDKIDGGFALYAMSLDKVDSKLRAPHNHGPRRTSLDWRLEDERIVGSLPKEMEASSSIVVSGRMDFGPFSEYGIDVDDLQQHFSSDQLLNKKTPLKVPAHEKMKEKPFYMEVVGCDSEVVATVHGLSTSTDKETPISVCFYALGGKKIGCEDAETKDDDAVVARLHIDAKLGGKTTIFAKTRAMFPSDGEKGTIKFITVSAEYAPECTF